MDTFDYLGVGSREDSYSDLISNAFISNERFRNNLLNNLGLTNDGNWKIESRLAVRVKKRRDSRPQKLCPDIVMFNRQLREVAIIENKVNARESNNQTKDYSANYFKRAIIDKIHDIDNPSWKFFYLTLDGSKPCSDDFLPIIYSNHILRSIPKTGNGLDYRLLTEMAERIRTYQNWPKPKLGDNVGAYLRNKSGLVNTDLTFRNSCALLFKSISLKKEDGNKFRKLPPTVNRIFLYKDRWIGDESHLSGVRNWCFIYLQFKWVESKDTACLLFNYEPWPCESQKSIRRRKARSSDVTEFFNRYEREREGFVSRIAKSLPAHFKASRGNRTIAKYDINLDISFMDLKTDIKKIIDPTIALVDSNLF